MWYKCQTDTNTPSAPVPMCTSSATPSLCLSSLLRRRVDEEGVRGGMTTTCLLPPDIRCFVPCGGSPPNPRAWNGAAAHRAMSRPRTRSGCTGPRRPPLGRPRTAGLFVSGAASATAARSCGFQDPLARGEHLLPAGIK